jgi:hypothetical protein
MLGRQHNRISFESRDRHERSWRAASHASGTMRRSLQVGNQCCEQIASWWRITAAMHLIRAEPDWVVLEIHRVLPNASPLPNRQSRGLTLAQRGRTPAGIVPGLCCVLWSWSRFGCPVVSASSDGHYGPFTLNSLTCDITPSSSAARL